MARKKTEAAPPADDFAGRVLAEVEREFGEGIITSGRDAADEVKMVIPLSPGLDAITSGGFEEGSLVGISGEPKTCKSSVALCLAAQAQRPEYGSRPVYYAKVEGRLSLSLLKGTAGLALDDGRFNVIQSSDDKLLTAQDFLRILRTVITTVPGAFVIIDSISALSDEREVADGVGTETRGGGAKLFSQFCRLINQVVPVRKSIVVGISHLISNTSGMGPPKVERSPVMWRYMCNYLLKVVGKSAWQDSDKRQIGYKVRWACNASPLGPPGMAVESYIRFGLGIDGLYEAVQYAVAGGLIKRRGNWLSLDYLAETPELLEGGEVPQANGAERACQLLRGRPDLCEPLLRKVRSLACVGGVED